VQQIRTQLVGLATAAPGYTAVLMQGSGTFSVESCIGTMLPPQGKLCVLSNGAYGQRIQTIARMAGIPTTVVDFGEMSPVDAQACEQALQADSAITHIAVVHNETTTGMLNPIEPIGKLAREYGKVLMVDAMSSFGGIPFDMEAVGADFVVSSANKCIQGVPGFGFIIAREQTLRGCEGFARSHSLDMFDQWRAMERGQGKWRFTSPTHVVRAFKQALEELQQEGGVAARYGRYCENHRILVQGMEKLGFRCLLDKVCHSPIITSFFNPQSPDYTFARFYELLKHKGFVIYPGKVSGADCFRIGTIGDVYPDDFRRLIDAVEASMYWR
jgi:2-aminoethylphosphonate-pyruvate transaminase